MKWHIIVEDMYFLHSIQIQIPVVFGLKSLLYCTFTVNFFDLSTICLRLQDVVISLNVPEAWYRTRVGYPVFFPLFSSSCLLYSYSYVIVEAFKLSTVSGIRKNEKRVVFQAILAFFSLLFSE